VPYSLKLNLLLISFLVTIGTAVIVRDILVGTYVGSGLADLAAELNAGGFASAPGLMPAALNLFDDTLPLLLDGTFCGAVLTPGGGAALCALI
jgi:hypothetical protein